MKRWLKRFSLLLLVIVVLAVGMFAYVTSDAGIQALILPKVSEALQTPVTADKFNLSVGTGLEVTNLSVGPADLPLVKAKKVLVAWRLGELVNGKIGINQLVLADADIRLHQDAEGNFNLPPGLMNADPNEPPGKIPPVDIRDVQLRNITAHFTQEGEAPLSAQLTISNFAIPEIKNGGSVNLDAKLALSAKRGGQTIAVNDLVINAQVPVDDALLPTGATLGVKGVIGVADGEIKLDNRRIQLDLEASDKAGVYALNTLEFRQFRGEIQEGNVSASGRWQAESETGEAKIEADLPAGGIHAVAAQLLGGWDIGKTAIKYNGEASIAGTTVSAKGKAEVRRLTVASTTAGIPATTPLDVTIEHDLQASAALIQIKALQIKASAGAAPIVAANLITPILLDTATPEKATGALEVRIDALDAALFAPFIPKDAPKIIAGKIFGKLNATAGENGQLSARGICDLRDFEIKDKDLRVPGLTVSTSVDAVVKDLDALIINAVTLTTSILSKEVVNVAATGSYRQSTGEGTLTATTLKVTPAPLLAAGVELPGLDPKEWDLGSLTLTSTKPLKANVRTGSVAIQGALTIEPIAGIFAGQKIAPPKPLSATTTFSAEHNTTLSANCSITSLTADLSEKNGGAIHFALTDGVTIALGEKPALKAPASWTTELKGFDLAAIADLIPADAIILKSGAVNAKLSGTANWPEVAATAKGTITVAQVRARLPGDATLPMLDSSATIKLDASWAATGAATIRTLSVDATEAQFGKLSFSIPKPTTIQLSGENIPQTMLPYELRIQANAAPAQPFMPKDSVVISQGKVDVNLTGSASFPKLAAATKGTITISNLAARAPGRDDVPPVNLDGTIALDAGWSESGVVDVRSLTVDLKEAKAGTVALRLPKAFSLDLSTEKPKQSMIPFELNVAMDNLQQFAGLLPQDAPLIQSGSLTVSASGQAAYPKLGAIAKAKIAVEDLKLHAPGANGPTIPRLSVKAALDGAWVDGEQARLQTLSVDVTDLDNDAIKVALSLTEPGVVSLKEGSTTQGNIAISLALKAKDLAQVAALLPKETLPVTLGGGSLDLKAASTIGLPKLTISTDTAITLKDVRVRPEGATAFLPPVSGAIKVDGTFADEWITLKSNVALRDPKGSLASLSADGRVDATLLRQGSTITITSTDTISVDRLLALLPESTTTNQAPTTPAKTTQPVAPAPPATAAPKLNLQANINLKRITYQQIDVQDLNASILLSDGKATIQPLTCNINGGPLEVTGSADLAAVTGMPFEMTLKASALPLRPVFASFVPKAGEFADGSLSTLSLTAKGPDIAWPMLEKTLVADFNGEIDQLRLTQSGNIYINTLIGLALPWTGISWEQLAFGDGKFSGKAANGTANVAADLIGEEARLLIKGTVSLGSDNPNLLITPYGRGRIASKSKINAQPDDNGFVQLNVPIRIPSWTDKTLITLANTEAAARMSGKVSGENAERIGDLSGAAEKVKTGGLGALFGEVIKIGGRELERREAEKQPTPAPQEPIKETPKEEPAPAPAPKKRPGLGDFGF